MSRGEEGQATVELALCVPLLVALLALFAQVGSAVLVQQAITVAAREAARAAAIDPAPEAALVAARSATGLDPEKIRVHTSRDGRTVTAQVDYAVEVRFPLSSTVLLKPDVSSAVTMYVEYRKQG